MSSPAQPCIILTRRRTGAADLHALLGSYVPWQRKGEEPFLWSRSMGEVSRQFHDGKPEAARALLDQQLAAGVFFKHQFETESWDFNTMLMQALQDHGYRVLHIDRSNEDERLFSMVISSHFSTWAREGIDSVRERLRRGETAPAIDLARVRNLVRDEARYRQWIDAEIGKYDFERLYLTYECFYRSGLKALNLADEMFAFVGLGARAAILDDASLLRFIFKGEHYTLGLLEYSEELRQVHQLIRAELLLAQQAPQAQAA